MEHLIESKKKRIRHNWKFEVTGNLKKRNRNPIKKQTERCVQITNNQREYSFEGNRSYPKNKRTIPSSPEETNNNKKKMTVDDFFQNASILPDGSDREGILKKPGTMIEKEKIKGIARLEKEVEGIPQNSSSKKKAEEQVQ